MNFNIKYILILLCFNISNAQYSSGTITYKKDFDKTFSEQYKNLKKRDPKLFEEYNKIWEETRLILKDIRFLLKFNDNESYFQLIDVIENDINPLDLRHAIGVYGGSTYYSNSFNSVYYRKTDAYGETFIIEMPNIEWKLSRSTRFLNGYNCLKAEAQTITIGRNGEIRRNVLAWYNPDIPIPYGPIGFNGLPGLIIELVYDNEVYRIDKIDLNPKKQIRIKRLSKGIKVTKIEFEKIGLDKIKDFKRMVR